MVETFYDLPFSEKLKEISFAPPISSGVFPGRRLFHSAPITRGHKRHAQSMGLLQTMQASPVL
jgi:hypothetical protein